MNRLRKKAYIGYATVLVGLGAGAYYFNKYYKQFIDSDKFQQQLRLKQLQSKSTILTLSNYQIEKKYGPTITTTIQNEIFDKFKSDSKTFSFTMNARQGKQNDHNEDFAEILVSCFQTNNIWFIDSLDIKFKESNSNVWLKLFETVRTDNLESNKASSVNVDALLNSKNLENSKEYMEKIKSTQPYVVKSVDILINDNNKLLNVGPPIKLLAHDVYEQTKGVNVRMRIEGKKRNADMMIEAEKIPDDPSLDAKDWSIIFLGLMYELDEDYFLRSDELAKKYSHQVLKKIQIDKPEWYALLHEININKILEEKLTNNNRVMNTIGRPIKITGFEIEFETGNNSAKIITYFDGRLNPATLTIDVIRESSKNIWKVVKSDLKIKWTDV